MATASCSSYVSTSSERTNFTRLGLVSQNELPNIFRKLLLIKEPPHLLEAHLNYHTYLSKHLKAHEWNVIKTVKTNQYLDFDISLMYKLIRNLNLVPKPTQGWGNTIPPSSAEITEGDDVERIRRMRNDIVHSEKKYVTDAELADQFSILKNIANRLEISLKISNREFVSKIENAETCCINTDLEQIYISRLGELSEKEKQSAITVTEVHKGLTNITVQLSELKKEIHKHREQVEGIPENALPRISVETRRIEVLNYGSQVTLKCKITSKSSLESITWYKGEHHIHFESFEKDHEMDDQTHILTLNDIKDSDLGEYKCEVHNAKGSIISEPIHVVYALPVVTVESRKIEVLKYGTQVTLKCKISSESNIKSVKWFKDEQHIPSEIFETHKETDDSPHILSFKEIKESNISLPVVTVEGRKIEVLKSGTQYKRKRKVTPKSNNKRVKIIQSFHSNSFRKKQEIDDTIHKLTYVTLNNIKECDIGEYKCEVHNAKGSNTSEPIHVVYALPVVTVESKKIEVMKYGTQIKLKCKVTSESNLKSVKWFRGEHHIHSESLEKDQEIDDPTHTLTLNDVKESDIGEYKCEVHNAKGSNTSELINVVYALPVVTVEMKKREVLRYGTQVKIKCKVTSESKITSVKWFRGEHHIHSESLKKDQEMDDPTYILTLNDIKESDIGEYKCEVHNAKGSNSSEPIHVVYALPMVTVETNKIEVLKYGTQVTLKCKIFSESNLTSVKWFKGEQNIHSESFEKDKEMDDQTHTLILKDIKESDIGEYKCEVHNEKGRNSSDPIHVVYALPVITVKLNKIEIPAFGRKISVSCDISSDSKVSSVVWYKGKHKIDCAISQKYEVWTATNDKASILTINDLQESDIAVYSCVIQNEMGMNESESIQVMYDSKGRKTYMDAIASGTEVRRYVRIQVIGKHRVGKSSLVRRLLGENIKGVKSTDGIDVVKRCLINTKNNEWIVDTDETERTEKIRRILRAKRKNQNRGEPVSDEIHPSKERKVVTEGTPAEPDIFSSELEKIEEESKVSKSITINETEYRDSISVSLNDNSSATDTMNQDKDILNTAKLLGNVFVLSRDTCDNQKPKLSLDNMTKRFISEMDEILFDVKRNQDKMASEGLVECGLWDFAGQKDYYVTHQTFLNPHSIYLLVADISEDIKPINDDADFDSIGEYIDFWFDSIHCLRTDSPVERLCPHVIVVCTHIDKYKSDEQLKQRKNEYENEFNMIMGRQLKSNHKRGIYYISNEISSDRDFDELKIRISKLAEEMQYFYEELPTEWIKLENALSVLKDLKTNQSNILSWQEIEELAQKTFLKKEDLLSFLLYQHKIGNILFFQNISDYIIIQPNWLIKCFRCLVCDDHTEKRNVNVVASTDWHNLINTGVLSDNIIDMLFEKEPDLEFGKYKTHLLEVMEKFDIIVKPQVQTTNNGKCKTSNSYYMPCMIRKEPISLETIQEKWTAGTKNFSKSPWLITEFEFLPLAYFNHLLFFYIRQYTVLEDEEGQKSIYKGKALVNLDDTGRRKLVVCFSKNAISLQIWKSAKVDVEIYKQIKKQLCDNIEKLKTKLSMKISYDIKAKCSSGENSKKQGRISFQDLDKICEGGYYFCDEHKEDHDMAEIENTWFHYVDSVEKIPDDRAKKGTRQDDLNLKIEPNKEETFDEDQAYVKNNLPVSVTLRQQINIKKSNNEFIEITSCIKIDNTLVFTDEDHRHYRLIICNVDGTDIHHIPLSYVPNFITVVNINTVAVSCCRDRTILIINISTDSVTSTIKTIKDCFGISYYDNNLYVVIGGRMLHVMDLTGAVTRIIPLSSDIFIREITVDRDRVVCTNGLSIYCGSLDGKLMWKFKNDEYKHFVRLTTDDEGNVYVISSKTNIIHETTVVVISDDGINYREILTKSDTLKNPWAIYFDSKENILLVSNDNDQAFLFDVKKKLT